MPVMSRIDTIGLEEISMAVGHRDAYAQQGPPERKPQPPVHPPVPEPHEHPGHYDDDYDEDHDDYTLPAPNQHPPEPPPVLPGMPGEQTRHDHDR